MAMAMAIENIDSIGYAIDNRSHCLSLSSHHIFSIKSTYLYDIHRTMIFNLIIMEPVKSEGLTCNTGFLAVTFVVFRSG